MATCPKTRYFPSSPHKEKRSQTGRVVRHWQEELVKVFGEERLSFKPAIEVPMTELPSICNSPKELSTTRKVKLRSAAQTITSGDVELKQFDPNFFSRTKIQCRSPGCKQRKPRQVQKEDLYLCASHRKTLEDYVAKMCNEKGIDTSTKYCKEDLEGYTSLIGSLESAFQSLGPKSIAFEWPLFNKKSGMFQEVCLNMRNFLIIVNALLNPDCINLIAALERPLAILNELFRILRDDGEVILQRLRQLVDLLRIVIEHILFAFGIIYSWIYLSLIGNPGAQLGAGIGGFVGMAGMMGGPSIGALTTVGGAFFGGLIGSGIYNIWYTPQGNVERDDERIRRYQEFAQANHRAVQPAPNNQALQAVPPEECQVYYLTGSATGDLFLLVLLC